MSGAWHTEIDRGTSFSTDEVVNDGVLIASSDNLVVAAEWPAGAVAAGRRMHLSVGSRELDGGGTVESGKFNLTPLGEIALLNAIRIFTPDTGPTDSFAITEITRNPEDQTITLTWTSRANATYSIENSSDLVTWSEFEDGIESDGESTSSSFKGEGREGHFRIRLE